MRRTLLRALLLVVASAALALAVNAFSPGRIPYWRVPQAALDPSEMVGLEEAELLWNTGGALFLDARATADYAAGHIPLAQNLPADDFTAHYPAVAALFAPDRELVVYCDGVDCDLSHRVREELRRLNIPRVRVLVNGWTVWREAGLPVSTGDQP